ncbi:LPXTG cell wall anchor domain-containing protein [Streptococcus sp. FSL R7-0212]|uniref:LPXTG cell wall anchor domain-containing protein n=1 Tax=Streptococcus sp. FSL R7-0212 TaxID=2921726 RepID=UPI0030F4BBA7
MKKTTLLSSIAIATILLGGSTIHAEDMATTTTQPGTVVVDTSTPLPGTGTTIGTDTGSTQPGTGTVPGTDTSTPLPGTGTTPGSDTGSTQPGTGTVPGTDTSTPLPGTGTTPGSDTGNTQPGTGTTPGSDTGNSQPGTGTTPGSDTGNTQPGTGTTPGSDTGNTQPGTSTTPGSNTGTPNSGNVISNPAPIVTPTPEAPLDLGNNQVITGISDGVAILSDGSNKPLSELGAKDNGDQTYTVKTKDNKLVTLPTTGEHTGLLLGIVGFVLFIAGAVLSYKKKKSNNSEN